MPRLSIIIPAPGNWEALETTLVSVLENQPPQSEIIVALNGAYPDPYDLQAEVQFVQAPGRANWLGLVNVGLAAARSEATHILACGATVGQGWTTAAVDHFRGSEVASVAPLLVDANAPSRVLAAGCTWSPAGRYATFARGWQTDEIGTECRHWIGPTIFAAFYRRSALAEVGTFDTTLSPELAAADLALRLLRTGRRSVLETGSSVSIEPRLVPEDGPLKTSWQAERMFWRQVRRHRSSQNLTAHVGLLAAENLRALPRWRTALQLGGRVVGACDWRRARVGQIDPRPECAAMLPTDKMERRVDAQHALPSPPLFSAGVRHTSEPPTRGR